MTEKTNEDIITGLTPLEERLANVHPRLYFTTESIAELKEKIGAEPWARMFARIRRLADEGAMPNPALVYLLTGERKYLDAARASMLDIITGTKWPDDVRIGEPAFRDQLFNTALTYDWLYHDLDDEALRLARECLDRNGRMNYEALAKHQLYQSGIYTCNTATACLVNLAAAGFAIYGDVADVGPWLRFVFEKARLMTNALGPDGASQEGICYGGFYTECYIKTLDLVHKLLGWDFFKNNEYLRNVPYFYVYSMLPRHHITPQSVHLCFGDGIRCNWHGPDAFLRKLAATYHDPYAQWAAEVQDTTGATRHTAAFLNLAWASPAVPPKDPTGLPTLHHFQDKDIVFMRSGWDGNEAVFGFKCGPHSGHHALKHYQHCIGGGHMAPDAGSFLLFAHGDWLISDGWYARKFTEYRNTVLVNGVGQTGATKGMGTDWFECTELRREKRAPSIVRAESGEEYDYVIGNVAPAYEHEAGLNKFLRHVLYVKPYCWVIVDELETEQPATFDLFFHAFGEYFQTDRPFGSTGKNTWTTGGKNGALQITALLPGNVEGLAEIQSIKGIGSHHDRDMNILRLHNTSEANTAIFVTVLEAYPASGAPEITPAIETDDDNMFLALKEPEREIRFIFSPGQENIDAPVFRPV